MVQISEMMEKPIVKEFESTFQLSYHAAREILKTRALGKVIYYIVPAIAAASACIDTFRDSECGVVSKNVGLELMYAVFIGLGPLLFMETFMLLALSVAYIKRRGWVVGAFSGRHSLSGEREF